MGYDLGGGGNAFPFDHIGATVTGKILEVGEQQQTDPETNEPTFWQGGQPKMMIKVTLQTDLHDTEGDDGKRAVYLKGSRKPDSQSTLAAVIKAVTQATGKTELDTGGTLTLTYIGDGEKTSPVKSAPKQYSASYVPPRVDLMGGPQGQQAYPEQAPAAPQQHYQQGGYLPPAGPVSPMPPPTIQEPQKPLGGPQNGAQGQPGVVYGWLNGQAVTPDLLAAFQAAGSDPRTMPGFIPAP